MHLTELADFDPTQLEKGRSVYIASLDIEGAVDAVPHEGLMQTMWDSEADAYLVRFVEVWLKTRRFRVRLTAPGGKFVSRLRDITRGLPQGGILSPLMWILHFNSLLEHMGGGRGE